MTNRRKVFWGLVDEREDLRTNARKSELGRMVVLSKRNQRQILVPKSLDGLGSDDAVYRDGERRVEIEGG